MPAGPSAFGAVVPSPTSSLSTPGTISHLSKEQSKVNLIRDAIRAEDKRLRAAYPFPLGHEWQSACGLAIYLGAWGLGPWGFCRVCLCGCRSIHSTGLPETNECHRTIAHHKPTKPRNTPITHTHTSRLLRRVGVGVVVVVQGPAGPPRHHRHQRPRHLPPPRDGKSFACLPPCMPACLHACMHACLPVYVRMDAPSSPRSVLPLIRPPHHAPVAHPPQLMEPKPRTQEHDLIHELYFKRSPWVQHLMFVGIWLIKSNAAPWWRKYYHLRHHQYSGQVRYDRKKERNQSALR
jgi:hypothetical protein